MIQLNPEEEKKQVAIEEYKFKELIGWARMISAQENPNIVQEGKKHLIRFYKNESKYWIPSTQMDKSSENVDQIDVFEINDGYLYYINERGYEYLIYSRDLFVDFNKATNKYGNTCRLPDAACRLQSNLNGYYWEIDTLDKNLHKYEYFQNYFGTRYENNIRDINNMLIRITDFSKKKIFVPNTLTESEKNGFKVVQALMVSEKNELSNESQADRDLFTLLFEDVNKTNPDDLEDVKRAFGR